MMPGLRFGSRSPAGLSFTVEHCPLNHCSFFQTQLQKTIFRNTSLQETNFTACDLSSSAFEQWDMSRASRAIVFDTVLEKADFPTAYNYFIDKEKNRIKKAKFPLPEAMRLFRQIQY
jgi:fluoroquinolone resistance protein